MKVVTPEISWHQRDPIYSVDFQPGDRSIQRIASGGVDKIVRIWHLTRDAEGKAAVDILTNLRRHTEAVNVVRFSKSGDLLASAGDDSTIILWKLSDVGVPASSIFSEDDGEEDKECWVCHKTLRGHLGDVSDLSWSKDNRYLVSGSVDNSAIVWDVVKDVKVAFFNQHKSYVQGVAFDPLSYYVATLSADRSMRLYNINSKSCVHNVSKMVLPSPLAPSQPLPGTGEAPSIPNETKPKPFKIFHDDSLRSFFRRLEFSPDGQLLVAPAGVMELGDGKIVNATYVFARGAFTKPALYLPSVEKTTNVVRVNPQLFQLWPVENPSDAAAESDTRKEWEKHKSIFCLPYRIVYAVATEDSVLIYDTQQTIPICLLKNIHYSQISDLSWTSDGTVLIISSTDGFCTIVTFDDNELGIPYDQPLPEPSMVVSGKGLTHSGIMDSEDESSKMLASGTSFAHCSKTPKGKGTPKGTSDSYKKRKGNVTPKTPTHKPGSNKTPKTPKTSSPGLTGTKVKSIERFLKSKLHSGVATLRIDDVAKEGDNIATLAASTKMPDHQHSDVATFRTEDTDNITTSAVSPVMPEPKDIQNVVTDEKKDSLPQDSPQNQVKVEEKHERQKDGPKKRIQFTTISLLKQN